MAKHDFYEVNRIRRGPFRYVLSIGPIDQFHFSLSKEQLMSNLANNFYISNSEIAEIEAMESYVIKYIEMIDEAPHIIRYLGIPNDNNNDLDLVVIAKICNNGTCFVFSNDFEYLSFINNKFC